MKSEADERGMFGQYGGRFVPEMLISALDELVEASERILADPAFRAELDAEGGRLATFHYDRLGLHAGAPEASTVHQDTTEAEADE